MPKLSFKKERNKVKEVEIIHGHELEVRDVDWLWYPYIPYGKITLVQGDPGDGKSTFVLSLAALLTSGRSLPFSDEVLEPMNVIYQNTEDDAEDTVMPRFLRAGGCPERISFIREDEQALTFSDERIVQAIKQVNAKVLILDPLSSYIGGDVSLNMANEVRAQFNPLIRAAKETGCAIIVVGHINKMTSTKALYRTVGSIDVVGAARSALLIARSEKERPNERIMAVQKSNLAPTGQAIVFSVSNGVEWLEQVERSADDILGGFSGPVGRPNAKQQEAKDMLCALLRDGPKAALEVRQRMRECNIGSRTTESAKAALGVKSIKQGDAWFWALPASSQ
jgi:archaellum biogenesis ATPase FlaH